MGFAGKLETGLGSGNIFFFRKNKVSAVVRKTVPEKEWTFGAVLTKTVPKNQCFWCGFLFFGALVFGAVLKPHQMSFKTVPNINFV